MTTKEVQAVGHVARARGRSIRGSGCTGKRQVGCD